ncbi:tetratricopeptide repeat-containing sensor histidine kinase [Maribacter luteus]|uniref:Oxygen sensor histidine kinase NreB n=1 Tax=Maribacter luteus TaxID=2594478 RepID=A0A6I2MH30_9FLAO|nr:sensor histidine kinase [Maribacter luteus]MRX63171.1 tetratricopeptide repeat protein [Maribacter luteus]
MLFAFVLFSICNVCSQGTEIDSLKNLLKKQGKDSTRVNLNYQLSTAYRNEPDSSLEYIHKGIDLSTYLKLDKKEHQGLNLLAMYWFDRGNTKKSMEVITIALDFIDKASDLEKTKTLDNYGLILHSLSRHDEAAEAHLKALAVSEKNGNSYRAVVSLSNLGNIYRYLDEKNKALEFYNKALAISLKNNYKNYIANSYGNLGIVYRANNEPEKALEVYKKSIEMHREMGEKFHVAIGLMNLGILYESLEKYEDAKKCQLESKKISSQIKDDIGVVLTLNNLAVLEAKTNQYKKAISLLDSAKARAEKIDYKDAYKHIYLAYAETYSRMGNYKAAYENRTYFEKWKDSISNENYLKNISELEAKYETEKKEKEIATLSEQKLKNETLIKEQRQQVKWLGATAMGVVAMSVLVFLLFKQRTKNKRQNELIDAISETQNMERKRIAQDLHDSIGGSLALIKNKLEVASDKENISKQDLLGTIETVSKTSDKVRCISHNLMPSELIKFGLVSGIQSILDQIDKDHINAQLYAHNMEQRIDPTKEIQLYRITQEVIQNVLKHAQAKNLTIYLNKYAKHVSLMLEDDGKGYDHASNGGMGISNIKNRIEQLKGTLDIDSSQGRGTTFNIQIPV